MTTCRRRWFGWTAGVVLLLPAGTVRAAGGDEAAVRQIEQSWLDAAQHHDRRTLEAVLADDFVDISYQGVIRTKADALAAPAAPAGTTQKIDEMRVRLYGSTAVVTGVVRVALPDGRERAVVRFTDVLVKQGNRWRAVSAQETLESPAR